MRVIPYTRILAFHPAFTVRLGAPRRRFGVGGRAAAEVAALVAALAHETALRLGVVTGCRVRIPVVRRRIAKLLPPQGIRTIAISIKTK